MKTSLFVFLFLPAALGFAAQPEQAKEKAEIQARIDRRAGALEALRKGDMARADALLVQTLRGERDTAAWHLDYAEALIAAAIDLKDRDQYKTSTEYFHRATAEMKLALQAKDAPTAPAKAHIYYQLGFIAGLADGDQAKANGYFKQALAADATNASARAALQRTKEGRKELEDADKKISR